jgi:hypothetical protein
LTLIIFIYKKQLINIDNYAVRFRKTKKLRSGEEHNAQYTSDSGISGTYVPNMSDVDMNKWKAKHITGDDERIEIRKTFNGVQLLIIVYKKLYQPPKPSFPEYDGGSKDFYWEQANIFNSQDCKRYAKRHNGIKISMNGKLDLTFNNFGDIQEVVREAIEILL